MKTTYDHMLQADIMLGKALEYLWDAIQTLNLDKDRAVLRHTLRDIADDLVDSYNKLTVQRRTYR